jgi:hypothetical protein
MTVIYVSIGNSDDKLTQAEWSAFHHEVDHTLEVRPHLPSAPVVERHGHWLSQPDAPWQNACWCVEIDAQYAADLKDALRAIAYEFGQDSIAWAAVPTTEFIGPES